MTRKINLIITTEDLPEGVHGAAFQDKDGYMILINGAEPKPNQAAAFLHECLHIWHDDHNDTRAADTIEAERHEELRKLLEILTENP